jgi:hypothetical protein
LTARLVFRDNQNQIRVNAFLSLLILASLYFVGGLIYVHVAYGTLQPIGSLTAIAFIGLIVGAYLAASIFPRKDGECAQRVRVSKTSAQRSEVLLLICAFALLALGSCMYVLAPPGYLSMDKVERAPTLRALYGIRILLLISPVVYYLALNTVRGVQSTALRKLYAVYLILYAAVSLVEINREMLLALGVLILCWAGRFHNYLPRFFPTQVIYLLGAVTVFFTLKGILYPIFFASDYEGGAFAFGEVVNWARWTIYAFENEVDLARLHQGDLLYLLNALVFPASAFESASAIWFREILQLEGVGQTYGYSGLLSWYSLGGPIGVFLIPAGLAFLAVAADRTPGTLCALATFCFVLVAFRFFRSEYVLVLKTFLWQCFYPGLVFLAFSRIRIARGRSQHLSAHT